MHIGRLLCAGSDNPVTVFTDWFSRQADNAVFTVELIESIGADLTVKVFHKNAEDTGDGAVAGTVVSATSTEALHKVTLLSLEEMVRYQITVADNAGALAGAHYRLLPITWFDTARA